MLSSFALMLALATADQQSTEPLPKPKMICREDEQEVGSHIHKGRRCKTAEQWQQEDGPRNQTPVTLHVGPAQGDGLPSPQRPPSP